MRINFDANASVRPIPEVLAYLKAFDGSALNASSVHQFGQSSKAIIDQAKYEISELLNLNPLDKIIFSSGATESNNAALRAKLNYAGNTYACSRVEHPSVLECMQASGISTLLLDQDRIEDPNYLEQNLNDQLALFSIMAANNETGQIFDVEKISKTIRKISARARIHCDAVQAIGKYKIDFQELGVDTLAFSGHKLGALSGVGVLVVSRNCHLEPWLLGGPQQSYLRAGTENILGIKSIELAIKAARNRTIEKNSNCINAKRKFVDFFNTKSDLVQINRFGTSQLENTLSLSFFNIKADDLVVALDLEGVCISAGSACNSGRPNPSHVLTAHGLSRQQAKQTVRISFEPNISMQEVDSGITIFNRVLNRAALLRAA